MGLHRAFPDAIITGVDIRAQRHYPFTFLQADVMGLDPTTWVGHDLIWASPPCQRYSASTPEAARANHPDLIGRVREMIHVSQKPYIIENVPKAPLINPTMLCGTMFPDLKVFRHRMFETSFHVQQPEHPSHDGILIGLNGWSTVTGCPGITGKSKVGWKGSLADWKIAMGIDWMTTKELAESIPPAYSEFLGQQLHTG